ncbi:MAG: iron-containing redox enzyme family protein [Acidimicrobiales bacterium]|jgi:pyrroloquinoline quinone (PQQ) biosynthesis protein C
MTSDPTPPTPCASAPLPATGPTYAAIADAVTHAVDGRALLTHPFYQRWEAGELAPGELAEYAVHYRAFEEALPQILAVVVGDLEASGEHRAAALVAQNLADELGRPEPHLALFDRFADAIPAEAPVSATSPGPAAQRLVATYRDLVEEGPVAALAGLAAYETQASPIAHTKGDGLRRWYGMDEEGTEFWDVHADMDADHGDWALDALALLHADPAEVGQSARRGAAAWWAFLDERQAGAAQAA